MLMGMTRPVRRSRPRVTDLPVVAEFAREAAPPSAPVERPREIDDPEYAELKKMLEAAYT